jgi:GPI mannosyltransferase 3
MTLVDKYLKEKNILILTFLIHLVAAIFSLGFHHYDEYFQLLEFMNYKLGETPATNLPWEFHNQMRPWGQVYIFYYLHKFFSFFGMSSPFVFTFFLRLISSILGIGSVYLLRPVLKYWFKDEDHRAYLWAFFLMNCAWYIPYMHVRPSSESWGTSVFLIAFSYFFQAVTPLNKKYGAPKILFFSGLLFGLSYIFRLPLAFSVAIIWFWGAVSLHRSGGSLLKVFYTALGIILMIALLLYSDTQGYGRFVFTSWEYFVQNLLEGKMKNFGVQPFYWYLTKGFTKGVPPLTILLIVATLWFWFKHSLHSLTLMTLPFFIIHSFLGHKELRFLFPILSVLPVFIVFYLVKYSRHWKRFLGLFFVINIVVLLISVVRPANSSLKIFKFIYEHKEIEEIGYYDKEGPFSLVGIPVLFYRRKGIKLIPYKKKEDLIKYRQGRHVFLKNGEDYEEFSKDPQCSIIFSNYPAFMLKMDLGKLLNKSRIWSLFDCRIKQ